MESVIAFILIPLIGYFGLWMLGIAAFIIYFKIFKIPIDLKHSAEMIRKLPAHLSIITVPICSFTSFFITTNIILKEFSISLNIMQLLQLGLASLFITIILDLLITVKEEKMNIDVFPINIMYLLGWLAIVPAVLLA